MMPRGPRGEKRPADVIGNAVKVMRIATGEEEEELPDSTKSAAAELGSRGGSRDESREGRVADRGHVLVDGVRADRRADRRGGALISSDSSLPRSVIYRPVGIGLCEPRDGWRLTILTKSSQMY
jgi:hypothetical protein